MPVRPKPLIWGWRDGSALDGCALKQKVQPLFLSYLVSVEGPQAKFSPFIEVSLFHLFVIPSGESILVVRVLSAFSFNLLFNDH